MQGEEISGGRGLVRGHQSVYRLGSLVGYRTVEEQGRPQVVQPKLKALKWDLRWGPRRRV